MQILVCVKRKEEKEEKTDRVRKETKDGLIKQSR
jgi:hypothetical protein